MSWTVARFPDCTHHTFLSHSREDHDTLVRPVFARLKSDGINPWIDRHHYQYGPDSRTALQDAILRCRHVVFFITPALLKSPRGWCVLELAYAEILNRTLTFQGEQLTNVFLPLMFLPKSSRRGMRTVWQPLRDRAAFCPVEDGTARVNWACLEITRFLKAEQRKAADIQKTLERDSKFRKLIASETGLRDRIARFDPQPIPEE